MNKVKVQLLTIALALATSFSATAGDVSQGQQHYQRNCAQCHGDNGKPRLPRVPNFQRKEGLLTSDKALFERIKHGKRSCPAYSGLLREQEIIDVISYLRTLG